MTQQLGYIGPGIMGRAMISNLLAAGFAVNVYARRESTREALRSEGLQVFASAAEVAALSDVVFICVSDTPDVEAVMFAAGGLAERLRPASLLIDMSTISPLQTREFAARLARLGVEYLDAPVSGGEQGAKAGTLSIMAGGSTAAFARALPLLQVLGSNIVHVGEVGAGQTAKACNQVLVAQTITAVAEALTLAEAAGVDAGKVREALLGGFANSKILEVHGQRMLVQNYTPGFKARLHLKDMNIVNAMAAELGLDLQGAQLASRHLQQLVESDQGELDSAAIKRCITPSKKSS